MGLREVVIGVVMILFFLPMLWDKIPPNRFVGFRIPQTFRSKEAWYDINRYGAWQIIIWSLVLCATGVAKTFLPPGNWSTSGLARWTLLCGPILICLLVPIVITLVYAVRYDRQHR